MPAIRRRNNGSSNNEEEEAAEKDVAVVPLHPPETVGAVVPQPASKRESHEQLCQRIANLYTDRENLAKALGEQGRSYKIARKALFALSNESLVSRRHVDVLTRSLARLRTKATRLWERNVKRPCAISTCNNHGMVLLHGEGYTSAWNGGGGFVNPNASHYMCMQHYRDWHARFAKLLEAGMKPLCTCGKYIKLPAVAPCAVYDSYPLEELLEPGTLTAFAADSCGMMYRPSRDDVVGNIDRHYGGGGEHKFDDSCFSDNIRSYFRNHRRLLAMKALQQPSPSPTPLPPQLPPPPQSSILPATLVA